MKILLVDPVGTGHHQEYITLLACGLKAHGVRVHFLGPLSLLNMLASNSLIQDGIPFDEISFGANYFKNEHMRLKLCQKTISVSRKMDMDICHFLYMDHFFISALSSGIWKNKSPAVCATLHWAYFLPAFAPTNLHKLKGIVDLVALRFLISCGMRVMTHSEKIVASLSEITGMPQFDYVPYPVKIGKITDGERSVLRSQLRSRIRLAPQDILLMFFGDTRFDKGADLAVKMLALLPPQYHLLFAGRETHFSRGHLAYLASENSVLERVHFDNYFIPQDEVSAYFCGCDIVLLPYRKTFAGQSGPLTIAAALGSKVVAPDLPVLAETILNNPLGWLYPAEDLGLMAHAVRNAVDATILAHSEKFSDEHSPSAFSTAVIASYIKAISA